MIRLFFFCFLGLAFQTMAQIPPYKATFDIKWPDGNKTRVMLSDSLGRFYLLADSTIEFDAKLMSNSIYLKADNKQAECVAGPSFLVAGFNKLNLGGGQTLCYDFMNYGVKELAFRNVKDKKVTGKLNYRIMEFFYCKIWAGQTCLSYDGQSTIDLQSYVLDTNRIEVLINAIPLDVMQDKPYTEQITIHPNPFGDRLLIESELATTFHLLSLEGKTILQNLPTNQEIDMSELEDGFYIAQVGNSGVYKRIIKR